MVELSYVKFPAEGIVFDNVRVQGFEAGSACRLQRDGDVVIINLSDVTIYEVHMSRVAHVRRAPESAAKKGKKS